MQTVPSPARTTQPVLIAQVRFAGVSHAPAGRPRERGSNDARSTLFLVYSSRHAIPRRCSDASPHCTVLWGYALMKWLKHQTATVDDERIARLIGDGGEAGRARYGTFWLVMEIIASQMEGSNPSCSVSYPTSVWARKLFTRGSLVFSTLSTLAVTGVVTVERDGNDIRVTNCNLLKYRDEYSRKSGVTPENVPARTEGDKEGEKEERKPAAPTAGFSPEDLTAAAWDVARAVIQKTGLTSKWITDQLVQQAKLELERNGQDLDNARDGMAEAWDAYLTCCREGKLRNTPMGAEKFFGEGIWKTQEAWGLRKGAAVTNGKVKMKSEYELDLEQQLTERRIRQNGGVQ